MLKVSEVKMKKVINISNGERLGYIYDFELDLEKGTIIAMVLPGNGKSLSFFSKSYDVLIHWEDIVRIGTDIILVNFKED